MSEPSDWALLARYLSGECSEQEKAGVQARIASDPATQRLVTAMGAVWESSDPRPATSDVSRLWAEIAEKTGMPAGTEMAPQSGISPGLRPRRGRGSYGTAARLIRWFRPGLSPIRRYAAAAALLVVCSLSYYWAQELGGFPWREPALELVTLAVENSDRDEVTLSDGTRIRLDAGSVLRYPEAFGGDQRTVHLSGEGYFEVASNPNRPFVVHAGHAVVEVLGTRFNVRAWQPEQRVAVAVAEGRVSLGAAEDAQEAVEIAAGHTSTLPHGGRPTEPHPDDVDKHLAWMHQEAFFDSAPLRDILYQLERWYDVRFLLEDTSIASEQLTLHLQTQSLDDVLELISALTGLDCEHSDGAVLLKPRVSEP